MRQDALVEPHEGGEELHKNKFRWGIETITIKETDGPMTKVKKFSQKLPPLSLSFLSYVSMYYRRQ